MRLPYSALAVIVGLLGATHAGAGLVACVDVSDARQVAAVLDRIARSVDPCGESADIAAVLGTLEHCSTISYEICTDTRIERNVFDRPIDDHGGHLRRRISWNPALRSELEPVCDRDPATPVLRDPTASLLHELVHAADDCQGRNPGEHELDAVRIENIYRRAAGLCQRHGYGEESLPPSQVRACVPGRCSCAAGSPPSEAARIARPPVDASPAPVGDGDAAPTRQSRPTPRQRTRRR